EGVALLFISHDLAVVRELCDEVAIMYLGEIVEMGPADEIFSRPHHPYSEALLAASLEPDPHYEQGRQRVLAGSDLPSQYAPPPGCPFHPRCHVGREVGGGTLPMICSVQDPTLVRYEASNVACHFPGRTLTIRSARQGSSS